MKNSGLQRSTRALALAAALAGAAGLSLLAQVTDQEQPTIDITVGAANLGGFYGQELAQVFTAGQSGPLGSIEFPIACSNYTGLPEGTITLEIHEVASGLPGDTVLATNTYEPADFPAFWPDDWPPYLRSLTLAAPLALTASTEYAAVLQFTSPNDTECGVFQGPEGDPYVGGDAFYREAPWGWFPLGSRMDLPFRTVMMIVESRKVSVFHHAHHWICIDESALDAHLAHGDTVWTTGCGSAK